MRFVDHIPVRRLCALALVSALASGCASFSNPFGPAEPRGTAAREAAKADAPKTTEKATEAPGKDAARPAAAQASPQAYPAPTPRAEAPPVDAATQRAFDAARGALAAGRTAEAEKAFAALVQSRPDLPGPHANIALIRRKAGRLDDAVAGFEKAVSLAPQRADLHNQLGITYRMAGQFDKARRAYEQAISLDPKDPVAVLNLGILHDLYLWDGERALELYDRYLQLTPSGDEQVKRWVSDLRNRMAKRAPAAPAAARKEQG